MNQTIETRAPRLLCLDVGNTLTIPVRFGLATVMRDRARATRDEILHAIDLLQTQTVTPEMIDVVCTKLNCESPDLSTYIAPEVQLRAEAMSLLRTVRHAGIRIATLSNVSSLDIRPLPTALMGLIARSYRSCEIGYAKPHRMAFKAVIEGEGIDPSEIVHVGDSWRCDVLGALESNIRPIWYNVHGQLDPEPGLKVTQIFSLDQLPQAIGIGSKTYAEGPEKLHA